MKRVLVIGCSGSGKTTFAIRLARLTGLPLIHLDAYFWRPNWQHLREEEWHAKVRELVVRDRWIMDGNYGETLDIRIRACDAVFFLDFPRMKCFGRVLGRLVRYFGRTRPEMPSGCWERLDWEFFAWIWTYESRRRPGVLSKLNAIKGEKPVIVLRSDEEIERFFHSRKFPLATTWPSRRNSS